MGKSILYGVLNWGLGHASRSAQVIEALLERGFRVVIASDGLALQWLQMRFPQCKTHQLVGYEIRYGSGNAQMLRLLGQLPKVYRAVRAERIWAQALSQKERFDGIISDNRLGFVAAGLPSVYLSHQLQIPAGLWAKPASAAHRFYMRRYSQVWVPDTRKNPLAGKMSTAHSALPPVKYLGHLSHLPASAAAQKPTGPVVAVLSGPEPQRSMLEQKLLAQMATLPEQKFVLVRGKSGGSDFAMPANVRVHALLSSWELGEILAQAPLVIGRSGYSSLMDYRQMGLKALLIPTPGQAEQEYLARHCNAAGKLLCVAQDKLDLRQHLAEAMALKGFKAAAKTAVDWDELFRLFERKAKS